MSQPLIRYVDNDELPDIPFEFEGIDLAIYSSITLRIRREDGTLLTRPHVIDDGANGKGHFEFITGDITPGNHEMEIRTVLVSNSKPETIFYPGAKRAACAAIAILQTSSKSNCCWSRILKSCRPTPATVAKGTSTDTSFAATAALESGRNEKGFAP